MMTHMEHWAQMERLARERGVNEHTLRKWRQRGVPYRWRLTLLQASKGKLPLNAFERIAPPRKTA